MVNIAKLGAVVVFTCIFGELVVKFRKRSDGGDSSSLSRIQTHRCRSAASSTRRSTCNELLLGAADRWHIGKMDRLGIASAVVPLVVKAALRERRLVDYM